MMRMPIDSVIADLARYNAWRRGDEDLQQPNPTELGLCLDDAIAYLAEYQQVLTENEGQHESI